jgi:hypothetical protein
MCKATGAMLSAIKTAIRLSAVAAVTTNREIVGKRCRVNDQCAAIGKDGATACAAAITRLMRAEAERSERIATVAACCSGEMKS